MKFCDERIQKHLLNGGKIKQKNTGFIKFREIWLKDGYLKFVSDDTNYPVTRGSLISDIWEIIPIKYDWNKIIKDKIFCQFWDELEVTDTLIVGYLTKKTAEGFCGKNCIWEHCKPFNPAEYNIAKDLKEYEK